MSVGFRDFLLIVACISVVHGQLALDKFVPFGTAEGDSQLTEDDEFSPALAFSHRFYATSHNSIYVSIIKVLMVRTDVMTRAFSKEYGGNIAQIL